MKRKLSLRFALVIVLAIASIILGSTLITRQNLNDASAVHLNQYLSMVSADWTSGETPEDIVFKYSDTSSLLRITFMDASGVVIIDSLADQLENHLDRPEFQNLGTVYIRDSVTLGREMMYLAAQLSDNLFVRVSIPTSSILPFLNDFLGFSIVIGLFVGALSIFLLSTWNKALTTPLLQIKESLSKVSQGAYEEMLPLDKDNDVNSVINEINDLNKWISSHILNLNEEKEKNDFLLEHMNQGICVLDNAGRIVLVNRFLRSLFGISTDQMLFGKDYLYLFRDGQIQDSIRHAMDSKTNTSTMLDVEHDTYSVNVSYLEESWNHLPGIVLLFTDVTMMKQIETLKRDFFVNASHELKSPLTAIMGSAELVTSKMVSDPETIQDLATRIYEESSRMNKLVMDMLDLSKYESNQTDLHEEVLSLPKVIGEIKNSLQSICDSKQITWMEELQEVTYLASHEHMTQLFRNLIENSIQYGNVGGFVKITLRETLKNVIFSVEDNGIGIPKADQSRVFERFYRVDKARSKKTGGTGLGLSIVKHIAMLYDAKLELESTEGKGTKMTVIFPKNGRIKS